MTAAALAAAQGEMWAQRVAEAEARLCHTTDPRALRAAIAAHEQHEADWQANRRTDGYVKLEAQAQRQAAQQETAARAAGLRETERWEADRREAERWAAAIARQEAVQQAALAVLAEAEAARLATQAEAARVQDVRNRHNGLWRGWGGLSPHERVGPRAASNWATDIDDQDGWTEQVIAAHLDMIPASLMNLR